MNIFKIIKKPRKVIVFLESKGLFNFLSDEAYLKFFYKFYLKKGLNLNSPRTFNEKIQWLKLNDRKDIYTTMVDKYEVKKYVSDLIGEEYIIPTLGVWDNFDDIDFESLPNQFVLKCTHDSGGNVICSDKTNFDKKSAKKTINKSLKKNYFYHGREWPYKNVRPRIIVENYLDDTIIDYKFLCYNGVVRNVFTCTGRESGNLCVDFFDLDWNILPFKRTYPNSKREIKKPMNFNKMIEISEVLAKGTKLVRIDFYEINGKLYFGEITFSPGSGFESFSPDDWDFKLGEMIEI